MVSASGAILVSGSDLAVRDVLTTVFFRADCCAILFAIALWVSARLKNRETTMAMALLGSLLIAATVSTSHAAARIDDRVLLLIITAAHHLGTAT